MINQYMGLLKSVLRLMNWPMIICKKNKDINTAAKKFINYQIAKCTTSGFLSGLGGLVTLPVAIPANIGSVIYVQMRMIACLAYMGGYDTDSDQVQTLVYACLAGISIDQLIKNVGIQFGTKFTMSMVKKIPGKVLTKINQKVGFRFLTKLRTEHTKCLSKGICGLYRHKSLQWLIN